ncbi:MAG: cation:dicarboxylase symporter family transporter, partial [Candidatus Eremiobacterota bacterium]
MAKIRLSLPLHYQILIALIAGGLFGYWFPSATIYTNWAGDIFLRALNMIIVPLILFSISSGVASVGGSSNLGRLGLKTLGFYVISTLVAIVTGFFFVSVIKPGTGAELGFTVDVENISAATDNFGQTLIKIIPSNIFEALVQGQMLAIIFFAVLFGFFLTRINEKPRVLLTDIIQSVLDVIMKITLFIIKFTPIGIFSITAKVISQQVLAGNDVGEVISRLGLYFLTVLAGLFFHAFITLPLAVKILGRARPFRHFRNMLTPL